MNYVTTSAIEPALYNYRTNQYSQRYFKPKLPDYSTKFFPRYERERSVHTLVSSYLVPSDEAKESHTNPKSECYSSCKGVFEKLAGKNTEGTDSWVRFFCQPIIIYPNNCKEVNEKMDENIQEKLTSYLELLDEIKQKTDDERTAVSLLQEVSKDRRMEAIRDEREAKNNVPATDKQKKFMKKLGIDFPEKVTKQEASMLIDEELGKNGG